MAIYVSSSHLPRYYGNEAKTTVQFGKLPYNLENSTSPTPMPLEYMYEAAAGSVVLTYYMYMYI